MFSFPVLSLVTLTHVRLATSAQRMSGLDVFLSTRFMVFAMCSHSFILGLVECHNARMVPF